MSGAWLLSHYQPSHKGKEFCQIKILLELLLFASQYYNSMQGVCPVKPILWAALKIYD
jgi:hypothetical protein